MKVTYIEKTSIGGNIIMPQQCHAEQSFGYEPFPTFGYYLHFIILYSKMKFYF